MDRTDRLRWVKDDDPRWDADRERVFATVPDGVFRPSCPAAAASGCPATGGGSEAGRRVVGYGWLDDVWGDAEILLAVEDGARGTGAGAFALARLEDGGGRARTELRGQRGPRHPSRPRRSHRAGSWRRGFAGTDDGRLRKQVGDGARHRAAPGGRPGTGRGPAAGRGRAGALRRRAASGPPAGPAPYREPGRRRRWGPGHEESGGYVDAEQHRY